MIDVENNFNPNIHLHRKRHQSFIIEVSHCVNETTNPWGDATQEHKLCLYCLIFDNHPLFTKLTSLKPYDYSHASNILNFPFHGGVTYALPILSHDLKGELKLGSIRIGCDYNHYGDEYYNEDRNFPYALRSVCNDAQQLYEYLEKIFLEEKGTDNE